MPNDETFFHARPNTKGKKEKVGVRLVIEGRVQQVGFCQWLKQISVKQGVTGWVREKGDETVEAFLYGQAERVSDVTNLCYQGPSYAHVKKVKEFPQRQVENEPVEFVILSGT